MRVRVALIGNPNVGKTLIFNDLTGGKAHIGNWPGKTVEKKEGKLLHRGVEIHITDLPGTYSLTAKSIDELIARNFIVEEKPDVVVDVVDASNLERNLYLVLQLLELEANVVIALNKYDVAEDLGYQIDVNELSKFLGVPVVPTVATTKQGIEELKDTIIEAARTKDKSKKFSINYGKQIEEYISKMMDILQKDNELSSKYPVRWLAIKILEEDDEVLKLIDERPIKDAVRTLLSEAKNALGEDVGVILAERRYSLISEALPKILKGAKPLTLSDLLDKALLDKYLGIPIFLALWWALFSFTFNVSAPFSDLIDWFFSKLGEIAETYISDQQLASLVADGIFRGLGGVLAFLPPIFFLFFGLALLEDSGYLARAAFLMDKVMYKLGLHGKSFIPMLLGFGCNVPAVMATRTIDSEEDRILTILVAPLISCSARLPIYILVGSAVLGEYAAVGVFSMYVLGLVLAVLVALSFRRLLPYFKGKPSPLILELPMYAKPTLRTTLIHMWERGSLFLKKAGTIIFLGIVAVWFLSNYPWESVHQGDRVVLENSYLGVLGKYLEPLVRPLGFNWMHAVALMLGFVAKEIVVGTFATLFGLTAEGETSEKLIDALRSSGVFTPLTGLAFMAFSLIYMPCLATLAAIRRETGSWKWTIFAVIYGLALAYSVALVIVTVGRLLGYA
ncbi:ferrous iron transport protein B [Thermofilum pendens]|uniref:Ferrous iron transport protein B n=1 Tax=Thermofilum pendens (strain DSM 2475 / Hrk 5) TaxID=368408 RepID=A1RYU6_THEPD|nr:ferrous iron transport protein B [Thermofilum pendens]ABL78376.1 ferrous iron transport protein B [Thermofilum pendens Hrk 5]